MSPTLCGDEKHVVEQELAGLLDNDQIAGPQAREPLLPDELTRGEPH